MPTEIKNENNHDSDEINELQLFVIQAQSGAIKKEDIVSKKEYIESQIENAKKQLDDLERRKAEAYSKGEEINIVDMFIDSDIAAAQYNIDKLNEFYCTLDEILEDYKNFNKNKCFSNIRELLKSNQNVKIGQIEREAGIRLGYMARLEKEGNTSEPSMEFVASAAKLLDTSIDVLVYANIADMSPTEKYLMTLFSKLEKDTIADKLDWEIETPNDLNNMYEEGHPLFEIVSYDPYSEEPPKYGFKSKSYADNTEIDDNCYKLEINMNSTLYFMSVREFYGTKPFTNTAGDNEQRPIIRKAKELWIVNENEKQMLACTNEPDKLAPIVEKLYDVITENSKHPKIKKSLKNALDAFISGQSDDEGLPFN